MKLMERLTLYEKLMRLDKPIGVLLLLWPTLWGLWIATAGHPSPMLFWIFILGTVLMRSAGCVMNDFADREIDPHVSRTKNRPLAAGLISKKEALLLAGGLSLAAFLLILRFNNLTLKLSLGALFLAASYPYTKRFLAIPQAYLGIAFGFGIPMAFAAHMGYVPLFAWGFLIANIFWSIAYDTQYAMVDREDDLKIGIKTSAITFGRFDVLAIMLSYSLMLITLTAVGMHLRMGLLYYAGLLVAAGIMIYHYTLIRQRDPALCFKAFLHNTWVGGVIFAGIVLDYTFLL